MGQRINWVLGKVNQILEKLLPVTTPVSVLVGVLCAVWLKPYVNLVPWIFAFLTFAGSLGSNFTDLKRVILHPLPLLICLVVLHLMMPFVAWLLGHLVFGGDPLTITGLILAFSIPTAIISFLWVSIYEGNLALSLSIILIDTLLAPVLVPLSLTVFIGTKVHMNILSIMGGILGMIVVPSLLGMFFNQVSAAKAKAMGPKLAPFSKIALIMVITINSSVVAPFLKNVNLKLVTIGLTVLVIAAIGYLVGWVNAKLFRYEKGVTVSLTFNSGMRNISTGVVLAINYFPAPVAVPVLIGTLFQQVLAALYGYLLEWYYRRKGNPLSGYAHQ